MLAYVIYVDEVKEEVFRTERETEKHITWLESEAGIQPECITVKVEEI
jgi:hypothetical protein